MTRERRTGNPVLTRETFSYLSQQQLSTLNRLERFGWNLKFVRHPLFQDVTAVISNPEISDVAIIEDDGTFITDHDLFFRN